MAKTLQLFIWFWVGLQIVINLASLFFAPFDPSTNALLGDPTASIRLLLNPTAMLLHLGYLIGNILFAIPAMLAAMWRERLLRKS